MSKIEYLFHAQITYQQKFIVFRPVEDIIDSGWLVCIQRHLSNGLKK